jgi:hypothetical protein
MLQRRSICTLAAAGALLAGACRDRSGPVPGTTATYRTHDDRVIRYTVAPEARLVDVTVTAAEGRTIIRLTTEAPMSSSGGPLAIDIHFSDQREVAFVRNFDYPSMDQFQGAAVLDALTGAVLGKVDVGVDGRRVELAFDSALVTGEPRVAVTRYLPSLEAVGEALGGLERAYVAMWAFGSSNTMHTAVPFAGARRATDPGIVRETHFGPPPGTTNYNPTTPVTQIPSGDGAIAVVDHDSHWPYGRDYDTGFRDGCGDPILCGWFTWKGRLSFLGGRGADRDGDGDLDGSEVRWNFGYCAFPSAVNDTWQDVNGHVHWESVGRAGRAGEIYEYVIDPTTGKLRVWHSNNGGATWDFVYDGPGQGGPGGWRFFPAPSPMSTACGLASRGPGGSGPA